MKRILALVLFVLISLVISYGQAPQAFKYQAIARDNNGHPLVNCDIGLRISLLQGDKNGPVVYSEAQNLTTNSTGLIDMEIGKGRILSGSFMDIDWRSTPYYLKIEMDNHGGTDYHLMGTSELLSVPYALYAENAGAEGNRAGEWTNDGTNIYVAPLYSANNVGMGTSAPSDKLHVYGGTTPANLIIESNITGSTSAISRFRLKNRDDGDLFNLSLRRTSGNTEMLQSVYDASATTWREYVYFNVNTQKYEVRSGIGNIEYKNNGDIYFSNTGGILHNYPGNGNGLRAIGNTPWALYYIENSGAPVFQGWGLSAGLTNPSSAADSRGIMGWNYGGGYGVYGYTCGLSAVQGDHINGNYGSLGTPDYGAVGYNVSSGNYGYIGTSSYGVYGYLGSTDAQDYAVFGYGIHAASVDGIGYGHTSTLGGVKGYNYYGNPYTFGTSGYSWLDENRSGGCLGGYYDGSLWGCLAYKSSSGTMWAGYFTTNIVQSGGGKSGEPAINNGIGAWGDLFGATVTGGVYGTFTRGERYALYSHGDVFKDGLDISLQKSKDNTNTVLYTNVSTSVTVQTYGYGQLAGGKCTVAFDKAFREVVSQDAPVIVTVTPIGHCNGISLTGITSSGFSVEENNSGRSDVQFTFIAIGQRAGYENPSLPTEVVQSDYIDKVEKSLVDDGSTKDDAPGLYYENGQLISGTHPSMLPDPNKPEVDPKVLPPPVHPPVDKEGKGTGKAPKGGSPNAPVSQSPENK
jgi:hypothetical protein